MIREIDITHRSTASPKPAVYSRSTADATTQVVWAREFLLQQGYNMGPANVFEDNQSTIALVKADKPLGAASRHINIRHFFVRDRAQAGEVSVKYIPTEDQIADLLTKPLQGSRFRSLRDKLLNWQC